GLHAFLRLNETSYFSIVQLPEAANIPIQIGVTHAGRGENPCAPGALQHIAFGAANEAELIAMRDRIRSKGVNVIGPLDHGFCKSIYFAGPDSMALEGAPPANKVVADEWIDPAVLTKAGFSAEESAQYRAPAPYTGPPPVPQPAYDASKPHMPYPPERYQQM